MSYFGIAQSGYVLQTTHDASIFNFNEIGGDCSGLLQATTVVKLQGTPLRNFTPTINQVIAFDGNQYIPSGLVGTPHALLSATHTDTQANTVQRGSIIYGSGSSPQWAKMPLGSQGFVLYSDGTDLTYTQLGAVTPHSVGNISAPSITFAGNTNTGFSAGTANQIVVSVGGQQRLVVDQASGNIQLFGGQIVNGVQTTGNYTVTSAVYAIIVSGIVSSTITMPATPASGEIHIIKDTAGNAFTNIITIDGNTRQIDGNQNVKLRTNYGSLTLFYNGIMWNIF